jgi:molecular chaperone IbpA
MEPSLLKASTGMTWLEDLWTASIADFTRQFRSFLPYTFCVSKDKKTAKFEMAMAGYNNSDLDVTYSNEGVLTIKTNKINKEDDSLDYVHKGIANRFMQFSLPIFSSYVIKEAKLKDGLLTITFERLPVSTPTKVEVKSS